MSKQVYSFNEPAVGMDGEFFLKDNSTGEPVSSIGIIGGKKNYPIVCEGGGFLEDCVAVEINPKPATLSDGKKAFSSNITSCIESVKRNLLDRSLDLSVDIAPERLFDSKELASPQASISGCAPSYNAWDMRKYQGFDLLNSNYRYASGDIHLSWELSVNSKLAFAERIAAVRLLDIVMASSEVLYSRQNRRRRTYGKAGMCRPTAYGIEYKAVSNFWMQSTDQMEWVWDVGMWVIDNVLIHRDMEDIMSEPYQYWEYKDMITRMKLNWDRDRARDVLTHFDAPSYPKT